jgi:phosphoribosylformylglycinamidine cyclo-ligase
MPDMYRVGEYDIAGTIVGVVDRKKIVDGSAIEEGDRIIALESSGLHTNGYSLARKICFDVAGLKVTDLVPGTTRSVGETLLEPHRSYARIMQVLMRIVTVRGMAHITGGGITDNLPRILPPGLGAEIDLETWDLPPIFRFLQEAGQVNQAEMLRTFNCGQGFLIVVEASQEARAMDYLLSQSEMPPSLIGRVVKDDQSAVRYVGGFRHSSAA